MSLTELPFDVQPWGREV